MVISFFFTKFALEIIKTITIIMQRNTTIKSIRKKSYGHWEVIVEQLCYTRRFPIKVSSVNIWTYTTSDSLLIDECVHDDNKKSISKLIYMTKKYGSKQTF